MADGFVSFKNGVRVLVSGGLFATVDRATPGTTPDQFARWGSENAAIRVRDGKIVTCQLSAVTQPQYAHIGQENNAIVLQDGCIVVGSPTSGETRYIHLGEGLPTLTTRGGVVNGGLGSSGVTFANKLANTYAANEVWSLVRDLSGTVAVAQVATARNGTYVNATLQSTAGPLPSEGSAPSFGGTGYVNLNSASLQNAFDGAKGSLVIWAKVSASGIWTDGTNKYIFTLAADANNWIYIRKDNANNQIQYTYKAGGTLKTINLGSVSPTGWICVGVSWDKAGDAFKAYYNGLQTGSTQTGLGTWAGTLATTQQLLGAFNTTPSNPFSGYLAYAAVKFGSVWSDVDFLAMNSFS